MSTVRLRRLLADHQRVREFVRRQPRVRLIQADGDPPERYQLEYAVRSLRQVDGELRFIDTHVVEIALPRNYPRMPPQCRMLTPIFHPNIAPHAICIGDHWNAGEPLWSMIARIGEMLAYQSYNTKSPLNGEAARWADEHQASLPLDPVSLWVDDLDAGLADVPSPPVAGPIHLAPAPSPPAPPVAPAPAVGPPPMVVVCPGCATRYRLPPQTAAKRMRCKKCQSVIELPAAG